MMETETPRHAPPSRYKTVRRKPAISSQPPSQQQQPPPSHPQPQLQPAQPKEALRQPQPLAQQTLQRPLIELASHTKYQDTNAPQPEHQLQRHQSKFRKILRLNTSAKEHSPPPPSQPATAPPAQGQREHGKLTKSPERPQSEANRGDEDIQKQNARDDAIAKLEGKKRRSKSGKLAQDAAYDFKVSLHHDKHSPTIVPVLNSTDAGALLEKVRPGHDRCLLECWPSLGIQRQVRYFELVTDVVNTWDVGASSHLRMGKNVWGECHTKLEEFPKTEPTIPETFFYYYVTADKKWSKRSVSIGNSALRILKKDKPYDKDYMQTVNLDNFDIYSFTETSSPKSKLRCPTKYCFALKSQHKQSLFGKNSVFVHYFAIDDQSLFKNWYGVIAHIKARLVAEKRAIAPWAEAAVDGTLSQDDSPSDPFADGSPTSPPRGRRFPKPLLSPEELAQPPSSSTDLQRSKSLHHGKPVKRGNDRASSANAPTGLVGSLYQEVFSPGGLLGSDYEEKKRLALMQFKEERVKDGLLQSKSTAMRNDTAPPRSGSHNHHQYQPLGSPELSPVDQRSPSMSSHTSETHALQHRGAAPNRPLTSGGGVTGTLLNFGADEINTKLPHHHMSRVRSNTIADKASGGGLVAFATANPGEEGHVPTQMIPNTPLTRRPTTAKSRKLGYCSEEEYKPFTGTGLLARDFHSAGTAAYGHGVKTGRDAIAKNGEINPLLDTNHRSVFAPGSLLERRERETGPPKPIIDRDPHSSDSE